MIRMDDDGYKYLYFMTWKITARQFNAMMCRYIDISEVP